MGDLQYPTRLWWRHTCGAARHDGVTAEQRHPPRLAGWECMTEMDYIPGVMAEVRIGCDQKRDMTTAEQAAALALLIRMATGARDSLDGDTTIVVVQR